MPPLVTDGKGKREKIVGGGNRAGLRKSRWVVNGNRIMTTGWVKNQIV